jgi:hypothetical protein
VFTFQYLVGKPKQQRKIVIFFATKSLFFLSLSLQTFILLHFMKEKRQKKNQSTKDKSDDPLGEEKGEGGPFVVVVPTIHIPTECKVFA